MPAPMRKLTQSPAQAQCLRPSEPDACAGRCGLPGLHDLVHQGCIPKSHNGIPDKFIKSSFAAPHQGCHGREIAIEQGHYLVWAQVFGKGGKATNICKQEGNNPFLTSQGCGSTVIAENLLDYFRGYIAAESQVNMAFLVLFMPKT